MEGTEGYSGKMVKFLDFDVVFYVSPFLGMRLVLVLVGGEKGMRRDGQWILYFSFPPQTHMFPFIPMTFESLTLHLPTTSPKTNQSPPRNLLFIISYFPHIMIYKECKGIRREKGLISLTDVEIDG